MVSDTNSVSGPSKEVEGIRHDTLELDLEPSTLYLIVMNSTKYVVVGKLQSVIQTHMNHPRKPLDTDRMRETEPSLPH